MIESQFHSGQVVSQYRILEKLGSGGRVVSLGQTVPFSRLRQRQDGPSIAIPDIWKPTSRDNSQRATFATVA